MKTEKSMARHVGGASILVVFVIFVLCVVSVLSALSSHDEKKMVDRTAEMTKAYYDADSKAEETISEIDSLFAEGSMDSGTTADRLSERLSSLPNVVSVEKSGDLFVVSSQYQVSETQILSTEIEAVWPLRKEWNQGKRYQIRSWKLTPQELQDFGEDDMQLWDGN